MNDLIFFDTMRQGLWISVIISAPMLAVALLAGIAIGLFQALTSIQEMTLTFVPKVGLMLAAAACFDPREAVPLWERMSEASGGQAPPEFSSTHPNPGTRIQNLTALMPKAMAYRAKFCPQGAAQ